MNGVSISSITRIRNHEKWQLQSVCGNVRTYGNSNQQNISSLSLVPNILKAHKNGLFISIGIDGVVMFINISMEDKYSNKTALAIMQGLLKNKVPKDIIEQDFTPQLESELATRRLQKLIDGLEADGGGKGFPLCKNKIKSIKGAVWPADMTYLDFSDNEIETLAPSDVQALSDGLKGLCLGNNNITTLDGIIFADDLIELDFSGNRGLTFGNAHLPKNLEMLDLKRMDLSYAELQSINWQSLRQLKRLNICENDALYLGRHECGYLRLPQSLTNLCIDWKTLKSFMDRMVYNLDLPNLYSISVYMPHGIGGTAAMQREILEYFSYKHVIVYFL